MSGPKSEADPETYHDKRVKADLIAHTLLSLGARFASRLVHETANRERQPANQHEHATSRRRNEVGKRSEYKQQKSRKPKPQPTPNVARIKW